MAVKDSIGGWKDNAFLFKTPNACTAFKTLMGSSFVPVLRGLGAMHQTNCPLLAVRISVFIFCCIREIYCK